MVLQPTGTDSTRMTLAARRRYWTGKQRCEGEPSERRWISSDEQGKEGRLWRRMVGVTQALAGAGATELPASEPQPLPDSTLVFRASPVIVRLPVSADVVRKVVVDVKPMTAGEKADSDKALAEGNRRRA